MTTTTGQEIEKIGALEKTAQIEPEQQDAPILDEPKDELGAYLDEDLGDESSFTGLDSDGDAEVHPETQHEESVKPVSFFKKPTTKLWGSVSGFTLLLIVVLGLVTHSCDGGTTTQATAKKPEDSKDKLIASQQKQIADMASQIEDQTQRRQRSKYMEAAKVTPKEKPKAVSASNVVRADTPSRPSYQAYSAPVPQRLFSRAESRPSTPFRATPAAAPRAEQNTALMSQVTALQAQMQKLLADRTKAAEQVPAEQVATVPTVEEQTAEQITATDTAQTRPDYQNVVNTEPVPVAQVDGGIEEAALLSGRPPLTIAAGTEAKATLLVPIVGERSQVVLSLDSDIIDAQGRLSIPAGAKLLGYGQIVNGVASINLQTAVINGLATELPQTAAIAVLTEGKAPIIAKKIAGGSSGPGMGRTLLSALLDAGSSGIGQLLAPQTTSTFSSGAGISSQSINPPSTLSNAGLAAAGGLTTGISNGLKASLTAQPQTASTPAMGVKAGLKLNLVFTSPLEMLSAQAIGPEVDQALITSPDEISGCNKDS